MRDLQRVARDEALAAIPDSPATLEFRAIALDPRGTVYRSDRGLIAVVETEQVIAARGEVRPDDVEAVCLALGGGYEVLADRAAHQRLRNAFEFERATIWSRAGTWRNVAAPVPGLAIRVLAADDTLDHLEEELRGEIERARPHYPIWAGFRDGKAAGFAYCSTWTETWADISIDTIPAARRQGVAAVVVSTLIDGFIAQGKLPVWGAVDSNVASLGLAKKLGFTRMEGELFVREADW
jgi:L-amino acid N-acyltransferase YncA